jgi:hypothetical protein
MPERIILPEFLYSYKEYKTLIESLLAEGKVTGNDQNPSLIEYTTLNMHRMHRWEKTFIPEETTVSAVKTISSPQTWVIITEGWCGDAAQQIPVFEHLAALNSAIRTRYVLRDENVEFMNHFLTNGARAIPIVLCLDNNYNLIWKWGPRPMDASQLLDDLKAKGMSEQERKKELHTWYAKNKHLSLQKEIRTLITGDADHR